MDSRSAHHSGSFSSEASSDGSSAPYADIESVSNVHLLSSKSASVIFQGRKSSSTTVLAVTSLLISSLCLVGLGLFGCWVFVFNNGNLFPQTARLNAKDSEVCVPCVQVSPNPLDSSRSSLWGQLDVRYDEENGTEICCASTAAQFAVLFKLILQRQQAVKNLADTLDSETEEEGKVMGEVQRDDVTGHVTSAVSAHLVYKPQSSQTAGEAEESREQQWKSPSESPVSHVQTGLKFHDNRILVQTPGLYYVYCQILFSPSHPRSDATTSDVTSAYVRRYSILRPAAPDFLLKARHTRHEVSQDRHSSYVGGVFQLYQGDSLYVQVSRPDLVSHDDRASFFGLFRIGD